MKRNILWLCAGALSLALGAGCGGEGGAYDDLVVGDLVAAGDPSALFTINARFKTLIRIQASGTWDYVRLGGRPEALTVAADGRTLLALDREYSQVIIADANNTDLTPVRLPVGQGHNRIVVSPNSPYAVTFLDLAESDDVVFDGTLSLNEIRVIDLSQNPPVVTPVIVAFNPRNIVFSPDGTLAFVVSERRASFVPLAAPPDDPAAVPLDLSTTEVAPPEAVIVRPSTSADPNDLTYALIARRGSAEMFAVALDTGSINVVDVGVVPTSLQVTADGRFAIAVSRGRDLAAVIRLDPFGSFDTSDVFPVALPQVVGEAVLAPADGDPEHDRRAVLFDPYGNAEEMTILDAETLQTRSVLLVNPPTAIVPGPGGTALALHKRWATTPSVSEVDAFFDAHDSFSMIDLDKRTANPTAVEARPADALFAPSAGTRRAFVTIPHATDAHGHHVGHIVVVQTDNGTASVIPVSPGPQRLGALPEGTIYAVHDRPFGFITFVDPSDLSTHTASGFMLAGALD